MIRKSAAAGSFYPDDKTNLLNMINGFLENEKEFEIKNIKGVIVPHAGYIYSGRTAGKAFKYLENLQNKKWNIFLIGAAHRFPIYVSVGNYDYYETPLGKAPVSKKICEEILKNDKFEFVELAHKMEHSLEVEIPFLQKIFKDNFEIIPILTGVISSYMLLNAIEKYFTDDNNLFIFSTDMSHFLYREQAEKIDKHSIDIIAGKKIFEKEYINACGQIPVVTSMLLAKENNYDIKLIDYSDSGDTTGDTDSVVGYASFVIYKN